MWDLWPRETWHDLPIHEADSASWIAGLKMPLCSPHFCFLAVSEREGSRKLLVQAGVQSGEDNCLPGKGDNKYINEQSRLWTLLFWLSFLLFSMHCFRITYTTCRSLLKREKDSLQKRHRNEARMSSLSRSYLVWRSPWQRGHTSMKP